MNVYDLSGVKIVVADRNRHMRHLLCAILSGLHGPKTVCASCGETALQMVTETRPDLLITDWEMAPMNGIDLVRALRKEKRSPAPTIPIIMMSGHTSLDRVTEARDAGANEFLAKPVSIDAVYQRIVALIERPRPFIRMESYFGPDRRRKIEDFAGDERRRVESTLAMVPEGAERAPEAAESAPEAAE